MILRCARRLALISLTVTSIAGTSVLIAAETPILSIEARPRPVYIDLTSEGQMVNFDFVLTNHGKEPVTLDDIEVSVLDRAGKLEERRFVNNNGASPSIDVIGSREVPPGQPRMIFNPLFSYPVTVDLSALVYEFSYSWGDHEESATITVHPTVRQQSEHLVLPIHGPILVWDGHDSYSHHRRFDYVMPMIHDFGFDSNVGRYAYDLVVVDDKGLTHSGPPEKNESWFGFGAPVYAAGAGTVVAAMDERPDNRHMDMVKLKTSHLEMFGNYIVIRQADGEYALYGHIRQGSAKCKPGDHVAQGQQIASIGTAGSSIFPHLHFQLQTTADADGEGLPSSFDHFRRLLGSHSVAVGHGPIDTGDLVESQAK